MKQRRSHPDMSGQATALEVYARKGDLQGVRRTARSMRNLCRELELENETLTRDRELLEHRVRKLRATNELTIGYYRSSLDAFERFRNGITILQSLRSFEELPGALDQIRELLELKAAVLVLVEDAYAGFVPEEIPTRPLAQVERIRQVLGRKEGGKEAFLGPTSEAASPGGFLEELLDFPMGPEGGTCFIKVLRDKYQPQTLIGFLFFLDTTSDRYTRDKATDFLEHFCDVLAWSVVTMRDHEKLDRDRVVDALTGMHNRAYLDRHAPRLLELADRKGFPVSCLFLDLNGFKAVNDTLGHEAGDLLLIEVGQRLRKGVRAYDICVRLGGDEFLVLLPDSTLEDARRLSDRFGAALKDLSVSRCTGLDSGLRISAAMGLSERSPGQSLESLMQEADQAMYRDKRKGVSMREALK
ncbi:MAG: diguanylate cyclase domain-containing protein [Desulfohalobiaceae bacterium]